MSILTALFLVTTGVFTTLFITRTSQANDLSDQVTKLSSDYNSANTKANNLQKDLDASKRDLADAKLEERRDRPAAHRPGRLPERDHRREQGVRRSRRASRRLT